MNETAIEWTDLTWNPASGCQKVSAGCKHCYAETIAEKFRGAAFPAGFAYTERPHKLREPGKVKQPSLIFTNSMTDLFWDQWDPDYRRRVIDVIRGLPRHRFQLLTKRAEAMRDWTHEHGPLPSNVWAGVTIEGAATVGRAGALRDTLCTTRFISGEPLLDACDGLEFDGIDWLILGGESGRHLESPRVCAVRGLVEQDERGKWRPSARGREIISSLIDRADRAGCPVFFKQWGGPRPKSGGATLDGGLLRKDFPVHALPPGWGGLKTKAA